MALLANENFVECRRTVHMFLDVTKSNPGPDVLPSEFRIASLSGLRSDPRHLEKLFELEIATSVDVPGFHGAELPSFSTFQQKMAASSLDWDGIFIALHGEMFVGYSLLVASRESRSLMLGGTGVTREYRRRGIAAGLKRRCHLYALECGFRELHADNHLTNPGIMATNRKSGFETQWEELELEKSL